MPYFVQVAVRLPDVEARRLLRIAIGYTPCFGSADAGDGYITGESFHMAYFVARCQWRDDGSFAVPEELPDAWSLLDEEFATRGEASDAAHEDRLQMMQQRGGWMGVHRIGLRRLDYRVFEAPDFDTALDQARQTLSPTSMRAD
jgi:hypothetical protein